MNDLPDFIKIKKFDKKKYLNTYNIVKDLNTICLSGNCPNRYECFANDTATFMILGDICTRNCKYCNVLNGKPSDVDLKEPEKITESIKKLNLKYVVITCVSRDDLNDGGTKHFVNVFKKIKEINPSCKVELLISDLNKNLENLNKIILLKPDVINHNIETCKDLFNQLRPEGNYNFSLSLLSYVKNTNPYIKTKSGFMVGLGENKNQIEKTIIDLKNSGCDLITVGQYLQPSKNNVEVKKYYTPEEFKNIETFGLKNDIKIIASALVRSSYKAGELY